MNNLLFYIINVFLIAVSLSSDHQFVFQYSFVFYIIQLILFFLNSRHAVSKSSLFLSPSFLTLVYLCLNFALGEYMVSRHYGFSDLYYKAIQDSKNLNWVTAYFLLCNIVVYLAIPVHLREGRMTVKATAVPAAAKWVLVNNTGAYLIISCIALLILGFISIDLSVLGGSGNFSYVFQVAIAIPLCFILSIEKRSYRWPLFVLILAFFMAGHFGSKREILYIFLLILLAEVIMGNIRLNFSVRRIILFSVLGAVIFYIIIISSILRGYGNYNVKNIFDANDYVSVYMREDYFMDALVSNLEVNAVYGNSANAANYVFAGKTDLLNGSTFLKVLFIPVPRSAFPEKPKSMVDIYTARFMPALRRDGGSLPVILYTELLWNFHFLGLPLLFFFYRYFNKLCSAAFLQLKNGMLSFRNMSIVFLYVTFIQFVRGSGMDMWLLYYLLSIPSLLILEYLLKAKYFHVQKETRFNESNLLLNT
ncbi:hypothetical protein SAMN04488505_102377 [Chitinophaga rupis]|uniref:Oligosaccharide repeat unit polymerase n=1 Tax=Chitinophaga rupis TaxID=573321 RepID=A0A1H7QLB9_9BACT|nr:hypothetical protein SAMN04488505_102377 [Chitinophaga rupis]